LKSKKKKKDRLKTLFPLLHQSVSNIALYKVGRKTWFKIKGVKEKSNFYFSLPKKKGYFFLN